MPYQNPGEVKPTFRAVVDKTFEPAHEEFHWSKEGDIFWSIEYPDRTRLEIVGWEEV